LGLPLDITVRRVGWRAGMYLRETRRTNRDGSVVRYLILDSRRLGGAWTLDRVWERLGIGAAIRRVAERRRLDREAAERVLFALVAQRALEPGSKLAGTRWAAERAAIEGCTGFSDDAGRWALHPRREAAAQQRRGHRHARTRRTVQDCRGNLRVEEVAVASDGD
jgi:hypothetical protein